MPPPRGVGKGPSISARPRHRDPRPCDCGPAPAKPLRCNGTHRSRPASPVKSPILRGHAKSLDFRPKSTSARRLRGPSIGTEGTRTAVNPNPVSALLPLWLCGNLLETGAKSGDFAKQHEFRCRDQYDRTQDCAHQSWPGPDQQQLLRSELLAVFGGAPESYARHAKDPASSNSCCRSSTA